MRRTAVMGTAVLLVVGQVFAACANRKPVAVVASAVSAKPCDAAVAGASTQTWQKIESEGFSFCVPQHWKLDNQYQRIQSSRRSPEYRTLSWGAPDSTERVLVDLPNVLGVRDALKLTLANCRLDPLLGAEYEVGDQTVCAQFKKIGNFRGPDLTVVFPKPLIRMRIVGFLNPFTVLETVQARPVGSATTH